MRDNDEIFIVMTGVREFLDFDAARAAAIEYAESSDTPTPFYVMSVPVDWRKTAIAARNEGVKIYAAEEIE